MWILRYKYLRALGVSVRTRACRSDFLCSDSSEGMEVRDWSPCSFCDTDV